MTESTTEPQPETAAEKPEAAEAEKPESCRRNQGRPAKRRRKSSRRQVIITDVGPCRKHIKVAVERGTIDKRVDEKYKELVGDSMIQASGPARRRARSWSASSRRKCSIRSKGRSFWRASNSWPTTTTSPRSAAQSQPEQDRNLDTGPFTYEFEVEVRPQFDLPDYKGLKLKRPVKDVQRRRRREGREKILSRYGQLVPQDRAAAKGDYIIVDMATTFERQANRLG